MSRAHRAQGDRHPKRKHSKKNKRPHKHEHKPKSAQGRHQPERPRPTQGSQQSAPKKFAEGTLSMTQHRYGFVNPGGEQPKIFIPAHRMGAALHGDRVRVQVRPSDKGFEGKVASIIARRSERITGRIIGHGKRAYFEPDDGRLRSPMRIKGSIPKFQNPDPLFVARIVHFPQSSDDNVTVEIDTQLGERGSLTTEIERVLIREAVTPDFPSDTLAEAEALPGRISEEELRRRVDLRHLDLVTIDPDDAKDHDDALWAEKTATGFRVVIAIADVSFYVPLGNAIDREALQRCTSIYLPGRVLHMLPPRIAAKLASLIPDEDRLCIAVDARLDRNARVESFELIEAVMRSRARLTYGSVARAMDWVTEGTKQAAATQRLEMLTVMDRISSALREQRKQRGALDFDIPEAKIELDKSTGKPIRIERDRVQPGLRKAYSLVEEMMLLANTLVAQELKARKQPAIFRAHARPDEEKLELFCNLAHSLGHKIQLEDALDSKMLSAFLAGVSDEADAPLLNYLLLRSMKQAMYMVNPDIGHFGLAKADYLHFTSPIRRYPDLVVHRVVRELIRRKSHQPGDGNHPQLETIAMRCSERERFAVQIEREVANLYRAEYMKDKIGETFSGTISGVAPQGLYIQIASPFVDFFVPVELLNDTFELDELGIRLVGTRSGQVFTIGDGATVRLEDASLNERKLFAALIEHNPKK